VWLSTNGPSKHIQRIAAIFLSGLIIVIGDCMPNGDRSGRQEPYYLELSLFRQATERLEQGDYQQAYAIYRKFLEKYPKHPYSDDAAYRMAYMHIIAQEDNPYFNYGKAKEHFKNFIELYPNSHYIRACNNWLTVLNYISEKSDREADGAIQANLRPDQHVQAELDRLREENRQLKKSLKELQEAIER